ncbi:MAG TPA: histidine--tRNA ligase [Alphaproteobacteria bacterium]|nr:histidine--tRNA ligase [Alphaproteobacteria bacterium]
MADLQPVRGTRDLLPDESRRQRQVVDAARRISALYGYEEIAVPIFEFTEVFKRTLGDTSDIVTKEMYTFTDRGGEQITLRPEATAGIMRALISGGLTQNLPLKFFCTGPMFRYERPQKGRYRQFHQIDIELLGAPEPEGDVEVIAIGAHILEELGILEKTRLELNTLGDFESRAAYRGALVAYLSRFHEGLSEDSRLRLERNPLRILDSKDDGDKRIVADAPIFFDYLNEASRDFFKTVQDRLSALDISFVLNPRIVRGLDYYCHTVFEFTTTTLGAQGAVLAGGRYDGLAEAMGGPATAGVGWAGGIERLAMLAKEAPAPERPVAVIPIGEDAEQVALRLARDLRHRGISVELGFRGNLSRRMKRANKLNARAAVLIGEDELKRGSVALRNLDTGAQAELPLGALADRLAEER